MSKTSSIGSVTDYESFVNRYLIPCRCKSCGSTTAIFERLSGQFETIPVLLLIELGLITMKDLVDKIDQQLTIKHDQQTLHYKLVGYRRIYQKQTWVTDPVAKKLKFRGMISYPINILQNGPRTDTDKDTTPD